MVPYELPNWSVAEYVIPVLNVQSSRRITLHGTAFFLNSTGVFMTAGHVIRSAQEEAAQTNGNVALSTPIPGANAGTISEALNVSLADAPYNIAVGTTRAASKAVFGAPSPTRRAFQIDCDMMPVRFPIAREARKVDCLHK